MAWACQPCCFGGGVNDSGVKRSGSPCGADIGDRLSSSIRHGRRFNAFLQYGELKRFTHYALSTAPPTPTSYPRKKKVKPDGPEVLGPLGLIAASWVLAELSARLKGTVENWGDLGKALLPDLLRVRRNAFVMLLAEALISRLLILERYTIR